MYISTARANWWRRREKSGSRTRVQDFLLKKRPGPGEGWVQMVVQLDFQPWTFLRKEMFSPEKSLRAEKRSKGLMLVVRAFSRAFMEYSSLRIGAVEGAGGRTSSIVGT